MGIATVAEGRKTISIGTRKWERLKKFEEFGESFDDILNRLMDNMKRTARRI